MQIIRVRPVSPVHSSFTLFLLPFPSWMSDANFGSHRRSPRAADNARSGPSGAGHSTRTPSILVPDRYRWRFKPFSIQEPSEPHANTPSLIYRNHLERCMPPIGICHASYWHFFEYLETALYRSERSFSLKSTALPARTRTSWQSPSSNSTLPSPYREYLSSHRDLRAHH